MKNKIILMGLLSLMAAPVFGAQKNSSKAKAEKKFIEARDKPSNMAIIMKAVKGGPLYVTPRVAGTIICDLEREDRLIWSINAMKYAVSGQRSREEVKKYLEKQLSIDPLIINYEATDPDFLQKGDSINMPTLLMAAAYWGNSDWVEFCLKHGANVLLKDQKGRDAYFFAGECAKEKANRLIKGLKVAQEAGSKSKKKLSEIEKISVDLDLQTTKNSIKKYLNIPIKIRKILDAAVNGSKEGKEDGEKQKWSASSESLDSQPANVVKPVAPVSDVADIDADQNKLTKQKNLAALRKQAKEKQEQANDVQAKMPANAVNQAGPAIAKQAADEEKARAAAAAKEEKEQAYYDLAVLMFKDPNRRNELSKPENKQHLEILKKRYHGTKEEDAAIKKLAGIEPDRVVRIKPTRQPVSQNQSVVAQQQPKKSGKQVNTRGSSHATTQKNAQEVSSKKAVQTPAKPKPLNPPGSRMAATEEELEAARTMQERQEQRAASSALKEAAGPLDACYDEDAVLTHSAKLLGLDDNTPTLGHSKMKLIPHVHVPALRTRFNAAIVNAALAGAEEKKKERSGKAQARSDIRLYATSDERKGIRVSAAKDKQEDDGEISSWWRSEELKEAYEDAQKQWKLVCQGDDDVDECSHWEGFEAVIEKMKDENNHIAFEQAQRQIDNMTMDEDDGGEPNWDGLDTIDPDELEMEAVVNPDVKKIV